MLLGQDQWTCDCMFLFISLSKGIFLYNKQTSALHFMWPVTFEEKIAVFNKFLVAFQHFEIQKQILLFTSNFTNCTFKRKAINKTLLPES